LKEEHMSGEQYESMIMSLVCYGGNARGAALEAIRAAKRGDFEKADELIKECNESILKAHNDQTGFIQREANGESEPVTWLMVHAQDHLMNAMVVRDIAIEMIDWIKETKEQKE
jgi:PTS system cellobiose-specific IIA component